MTRLHHPHNKFERKIAEEKHSLENERKIKKERVSKVRRKLLLEQAKEQETDNELKEFKYS